MATQKSAARGVLPATARKPSSPSVNTPNPALGGADEQPSTPYSQAVSSLEPLHPILAGLAHRNRNQHRHAVWWRYFGMLRRNCAKLTQHLISAIAAARKSAARAAKVAKAKGKKRRREELASGEPLRAGTGTVDHESAVAAAELEVDANVSAHVAWLRDVLVPKCYLAFSQLTADNQFAPLGVVLMGVLAQVQAVCECAAPKSEPAQQPSLSVDDAAAAQFPEATPTTDARESTNATIPESRSKGHTANEERKGDSVRGGEGGAIAGKTISREAVERATKRREEEKAEKNKEDVQKTVGVGIKNPPVTAPSQSKSERDTSKPEDGPPAKKAKTAPEVARESRDDGDKGEKNKKKKKKKKAKKGDEFDDLFKGLF